MAAYARLNWEQTGLFAVLMAEVSPGWGCHLIAEDLLALDKLTLLLKTQGRFEDLIAAVIHFFDLYPETRNQGIAARIMKRAEAAWRPTKNSDIRA
jgi:GNAT superfamily N-acetyltransferase